MKHLFHLCIAICITTTIHAMELENKPSKSDKYKKACKEMYQSWKKDNKKMEVQKNFPHDKKQLQFLVEYAIKKT